MTITGGSALPKEDIEQMVKDAEAHAAEDAKRREQAEIRNQGDNLAYQTEKTLKDHGDKLDDSVKSEVESALEELREALKGDDTDAIKEKVEALGQKSQQLAEAIYSSSNAEGAAAGTTPGEEAPGGDDDVVDAEVVDEGDDQDAAS